MIIHPPSLCIGFVGCSIRSRSASPPRLHGRLDAEWIGACRKFTIFALLLLAIGNTLGMLWAYEELGWGRLLAWDPVENAAFMPASSASPPSRTRHDPGAARHAEGVERLPHLP